MRPKRFFQILCGLLALLGLLIGASAIGGQAILKKQSAKLSELKLESRVLQEQQGLLTRAKTDIEKYSSLDTIMKTIVPQDKDQATTVRTINAIAEQSDIQLATIAFTSSNLGQAAPAPSSTDKAAASTPTPAAPLLSQVKPVSGIPGVYALEITLGSATGKPIPYANFLQFLEKLESARRTAHVTKISITPSNNGSDVSFNLTLNAYIKP